MAYEPKILLTLYKQGSVLMRQDVEKREFILTKKDLFPNGKFKGNEGKRIVRKGKYTFTPLVQNEVTQQITMCGEAYDYMTSSECPEWYKNTKEWKFKLTPEQRLNLHLKRTCDHFGGKRFTYSIIED